MLKWKMSARESVRRITEVQVMFTELWQHVYTNASEKHVAYVLRVEDRDSNHISDNTGSQTSRPHSLTLNALETWKIT
jgi:hypothetical protein